jgi:hypothetical protein
MVLSTRLKVLLVAMVVVGMALGIIGVLGAVSASPNNNDDHRNDKGRSTLTVVGKTPEIKIVDLGPQGLTQGDTIVQNAPLYNATGKERIGRFDLFCAITDPADESAEKAHIAQCTKTFTLPGGRSAYKAWKPTLMSSLRAQHLGRTPSVAARGSMWVSGANKALNRVEHR